MRRLTAKPRVFPKRVRGPHEALQKQPPRDAAAKITAWSQAGYSKRGIAHRFGIHYQTLNRWLEVHEALKDALDAGREREHHALYTKCFDLAMGGPGRQPNILAIFFLLKCRHGYVEGSPVEGQTGNRISINFQLPGALSPEMFGKVIEHERAATQSESIPDARPAGPRID